jgi:hypothetical protein
MDSMGIPAAEMRVLSWFTVLCVLATLGAFIDFSGCCLALSRYTSRPIEFLH